MVVILSAHRRKRDVTTYSYIVLLCFYHQIISTLSFYWQCFSFEEEPELCCSLGQFHHPSLGGRSQLNDTDAWCVYDEMCSKTETADSLFGFSCLRYCDVHCAWDDVLALSSRTPRPKLFPLSLHPLKSPPTLCWRVSLVVFESSAENREEFPTKVPAITPLIQSLHTNSFPLKYITKV